MAKIEIEIGNEYTIRFEKGKELDESIYHDIYVSAARSVNEIISHSRQNTNNTSAFFKSDDYNNIIAFMGERGTGKTSSMISFTEALINNSEISKSGRLFNEYPEIKKTPFLPIDIIDPSLFSKKDTLFEMIISKMFLKFQERLEWDAQASDQEKKRNIIRSFQEVFKNLKTIHNEKKDLYEQEVIEVLSKLANGTNLRSNFNALVDLYLDFFDKKHGVLVLIIDDFDLNTSDAFFMLEDIRQFLIQRNVLIMLACKFEQLTDSVRTVMQKDSPKESLDSAKDRASKYLNKIIPIDHRKNIPTLTIKSKSHVVRLSEKQEQIPGFVLRDGETKIQQSSSVQAGLLELIYKRLGLFISTPGYANNLVVQDTMRALINVVSFVNFLSPERIDEFKYYLYSVVEGIFDSTQELEFFTDIDLLAPEDLNGFIISWVKKHFERYEVDTTYDLNSFGSVLHILKSTETSLPVIEKRQRNLLNFIRTFYNIRISCILHERDYEMLRAVIGLELLDSHTMIYPRFNYSFRRDVFEFNGIQAIRDGFKEGDFSVNDIYWLGCFISTYGRRETRLRRLLTNESGTGKQGPIVGWATFNTMSFISALLYPETVCNDIRAIIGGEEPIQLHEDIVQWQKIDSFILLYNPEFFQEFMDELEFYCKNYREAHEDYAGTLYAYLTKGINKALNNLKRKYNYIDFDIKGFMTNPIFMYWDANQESVDFMLNTIFDISTAKEEKTSDMDSAEIQRVARYMLQRYGNYFKENTKLTGKGPKLGMNGLIRNFKAYPESHKALQNLRRSMDSNVKKGLNDIFEYLSKLANG